MTSGSIPAQTLSVGESVSVDVAQYFSEPDDEALTYGATSGDAQVATVGVSASIVTVTGEGSGQANVRVSAMDPHGATAEQSFTVTVDAGRAPVPSGSIPAQTVPRGDSVRLELAQYFSDPDDDPLTYGATSSNTHVATVTIEEGTAIITAENLGRSSIRVTARDPDGETATQAFSVTVEAPGFTLSGAVRDRRRNGPVLAGAVVRLENGQRESTRTDRDGRYRFRDVSGTVTVTATAAPSYVAETVEVTMDRDRNADFALRHTGRPPFEGTVWITPNILGPSDPTSFRSVTYRGRGMREFWDRRTNRWVTIDVYLFNVQYAGRQSEFQVHTEFGSPEAARSEVDTYAPALGRLPAALLAGVREVEISAVDALLQGNEAGIVHIYTGNAEELIRNGFLEEVLFHEGGHASLDRSHKNSAGWRTAQQEDGVFISTYARDHPEREDVAESILPYFAVRYRPERLTDADRSAILSAIPNRLVYFDERRLNMSPYNATGTLAPVLEPSSFQPRRVSQPFEGPPTR